MEEFYQSAYPLYVRARVQIRTLGNIINHLDSNEDFLLSFAGL